MLDLWYLVDITDGVKLDDGPDSDKVAKALQLIPFLSWTKPVETMWSRIIPIIRAKALASDSHTVLANSTWDSERL